jgi:hypothetical protein
LYGTRRRGAQAIVVNPKTAISIKMNSNEFEEGSADELGELWEEYSAVPAIDSLNSAWTVLNWTTHTTHSLA